MLKNIVCSFSLVLSAVVMCAEYIPPSAVESSVSENMSNAIIFSSKTKNFTEEKAYKLQKAYVKNSVAKGVPIVGFKAGLTTLDESKRYGLSSPISGVLLQEPLLGPSAALNVSGVQKPMLELEFAYKISQTITVAITETNVSQFVSSVAPAIEIPHINFPSSQFTGLDIIANNAMVFKLMIGEWQPLKSFDELDKQKLTLSCDSKLVSSGKGNASMQGQSKALVWLINHIIDSGYKIQKDQVLITGNLVKMTSATPCLYHATFGKLGKLDLNIIH